MGNERKSRHTRMGVLIDERINERMAGLHTRRMSFSVEDVRAGLGPKLSWLTITNRTAAEKVTFDVSVIYDNEESLWVAECDLLGIVTEAKTFELLTKQVQDLVPDMIAANKIVLGGRKPYLNFSHLEEAVI